MFYVVAILRDDEVYPYDVKIDINHTNYSFIVYDETDNSLETVDCEYLIYSITLNIGIVGVIPMNDSYLVKITRPPLTNLFKLVKKPRAGVFGSRFNINLLKRKGVVWTGAVVAGDYNGNGYVYYFLKDDKTNKPVLCLESVIVSEYLSENKNSLYLGNTVVVKYITDNNFVQPRFQPRDTLSVIRGELMSVVDLYALAVFSPELAVGCTIESDNSFIVDTLTDRYVFEVKDGVRNYFLKCKLTNSHYFGLERFK